jgi:hypothetical protein
LYSLSVINAGSNCLILRVQVISLGLDFFLLRLYLLIQLL